MLATRTGSTLTYVQPDHLGSATTLTNSGGAVVAQERYAAFGERRRASAVEPTDQLYTSQRYSFQTGLYHYSDGRSPGRFYDPVLGRFIKPDTIVPNPSQPQSLNRYSYVQNSPLMYTDPDGHCGPLTPICVAGFLISMALAVQDDTWRANEPPMSEDAQRSQRAGIAGMAMAAGFQAGYGLVTGAAGQEAVRRGQQTAQQGQRVAGQTQSQSSAVASNSANPIAARLFPQLGNKLDFMFGRAAGSPGEHNFDRSRSMLAQLQRIGIFDTTRGRAYIEQHLTEVVNDASNIVRIQDNGRIVRESILMGPNGGVKLQTIWEGTKLITVNIFGGR